MSLATAVECDEVAQGKPMPRIILETAFGLRDKHMGGPQVTRTTRIRASCWGEKSADTHTLKEYLIAAVEGATGVIQGGTRFLGIFPTELGSGQEDTPDGIRLREIIDLSICHTIP
jgi:hypothetical protein